MIPSEKTKLIEELFNIWTQQPRANYPTWLELAIYMFEAGQSYEREEE